MPTTASLFSVQPGQSQRAIKGYADDIGKADSLMTEARVGVEPSQ